MQYLNQFINNQISRHMFKAPYIEATQMGDMLQLNMHFMTIRLENW